MTVLDITFRSGGLSARRVCAQGDDGGTMGRAALILSLPFGAIALRADCADFSLRAAAREGIMDPASIATAFVTAQAGQTQLALAQKMVKIDADQQSAMAQMIASAAQQASLPAGVGRNLDIAA